MARVRRTANRRRASSQRRQRSYLSRSVLCTMTGISEHQLRLWEYEEFIAPATTLEIEGQVQRVYDHAAIRRIRVIRALAEDLGVNLPGIGVVLHLLDQLGRHNSSFR